MMRARIIPAMLLKGRGFVKTQKFADARYIGDPVNIVRLFNDKEVDELIILDISTSPDGPGPDIRFLRDVFGECFMPVAFGGGIKCLDDALQVLAAGAEKVILNTVSVEKPQVITEVAKRCGSQSVIVSIDARRSRWRGYEVVIGGGQRRTGLSPVEHARTAESSGAGEIFVTSVDRDGTMQGYDLELVAAVASAVNIPVIASGGAKDLLDLHAAVEAGASAAAAGSIFVYQGPRRGVLVSYPSRAEITRAFEADR